MLRLSIPARVRKLACEQAFLFLLSFLARFHHLGDRPTRPRSLSRRARQRLCGRVFVAP
jgi:hypothetical protein